jgi:hypothetical protein
LPPNLWLINAVTFDANADAGAWSGSFWIASINGWTDAKTNCSHGENGFNELDSAALSAAPSQVHHFGHRPFHR